MRFPKHNCVDKRVRTNAQNVFVQFFSRIVWIVTQDHSIFQIPSHLDKDLKEHLVQRESGKLTNGKTLSVIRTLKQNLTPQEKSEIGKLISTAHSEEAKLKGSLDASEKISIHLRVTCDFIQNRRRRGLVGFR